MRNADGSIATELPRKKNLIMDSGLDAYATQEFVNLFGYAIAGTGTEPTSRPCNPVTVTQAGSVITSSSAFFQSGDVGRIFKYGDVGSGAGGNEYYITAYTDSTHVTVSGSATVTTPQYGIVWYVSETTMDTPVKTATSYAASGNGSVLSVSGSQLSVAHTRIFIFSTESGSITYQEIGWSWNGTNIFGRDLITPSGVSLIAGQQLEVTIEVTILMSPASTSAVGDVSGGTWNTAGNAIIEYFRTSSSGTFGVNLCSTINSPDGSPNTSTNVEPSNLGTLSLIEGSWSQLTATSTGANANGNSTLQGGSPTKGSYTNGSFTVAYVSQFGLSQGVGGPFSGICIGTGAWTWSLQLTTPQSKDNSHTLSFTFTFTWGRILVN